MLKHYTTANLDIWAGRIDSHDNFDAFRWHQWVAPLNLNENHSKLSSDQLGFAFIGFNCDEGIKLNKGRTGASKGPNNIRKELKNLPCRFSREILLFDAGNISYKNSLEETQDALAQAIERILELNLFPIVLGGGHEVAFGHFNGILRHFLENKKKPKIGIINFDAHFDIRPYPNGGTSGTMFLQIYDQLKEQHIDFSYLCLGIQKHGNTKALFKSADALSTEYILAKNLIHNNLWDPIEKIDDFITRQDHIYVTICADVFSSAFAPGVSAAQPLGLHPEDVLKILKYILRTNKVVSFDIAEVSPRFDYDRSTANLASILIFALVNTLSKLHLQKNNSLN